MAPKAANRTRVRYPSDSSSSSRGSSVASGLSVASGPDVETRVYILEHEAKALQRKVDVLEESLGRGWWLVLEVDKDAGENILKRAYRRMSLLHHPDKGGEATRAS